jgi:hypothetical protein
MMKDQQFNERAHANPHDDSTEFLEAAASSPERLQLVAELKQFDSDLRASLEAVSAPEGLKQTLLDIPEGMLHPDTEVAAANDSFWRRNVQYAAGLVLAIGVLAIFMQGEANPMEDMVFSHIYSELEFLDDDTPLALAEVNTVMNSRIGSEFMQSPDMENLNINVTEDCWVDLENGINGVHMVVQGDVGPVTIMVLPNTPVEQDMEISDSRFDGMISAMPGGTLVVVGEKEESIERFSTMLAANISW